MSCGRCVVAVDVLVDVEVVDVVVDVLAGAVVDVLVPGDAGALFPKIALPNAESGLPVS